MKLPKGLLKAINDLNFSGDESSWFDLWHIHPLDFGNIDLDLEVTFDCLFHTYQVLNEKMKNFPRNYQSWIEIDTNDPSQNAVYLHTENPNSNNFPLKYDNAEMPVIENELKAIIDKYELDVNGIRTSEGNIYFVYDNNLGLSFNN